MTTSRQGVVVETDSEIRAIALTQAVLHWQNAAVVYSSDDVLTVAKKFEAYLKHG
jgi:hypothetical protein